MRFKNILIVVENMDKSLFFYEYLFNLKKIREFENNIMLMNGLVLQEKRNWEKETGLNTSIQGNNFEIYFETLNINKFYDKLNIYKSLYDDIEIINKDEKVLRIYDPDKNIIEIMEI